MAIGPSYMSAWGRSPQRSATECPVRVQLAKWPARRIRALLKWTGDSGDSGDSALNLGRQVGAADGTAAARRPRRVASGGFRPLTRLEPRKISLQEVDGAKRHDCVSALSCSRKPATQS